MKKMYKEVISLDRHCYEHFGLSEDILMENASYAMKSYILANFHKKSTILVLCGPGNNGADGIALARSLFGDYTIYLYLVSQPKSSMAKLQMQRANKIGLNPCSQVIDCDIIVDAIFGSGFTRTMNDEIESLLDTVSSFRGFKLACDIPTGVNSKGNIEKNAFCADVTITMGALKTSLFSDKAKDFVGELLVADLGISHKIYTHKSSNIYHVQLEDLKLPFRNKKNTHKGCFGHLMVVGGEKIGAAILACKAAFKMGVGLVSLFTRTNIESEPEIMYTQQIPKGCNVIAVGMGLGNHLNHFEVLKNPIFKNKIPCVLDADLLYAPIIIDFLSYEKIVITPHPKEFIKLLQRIDLFDISVDELQKDRFFYVEEFMKIYPNVTLLLKGANTMIAYKEEIYIQSLGTSALSKGGSGDVLAGIIASLIAQGYDLKESAIQGSMIHAMSAKLYQGNDYSLTPLQLIQNLEKL